MKDPRNEREARAAMEPRENARIGVHFAKPAKQRKAKQGKGFSFRNLFKIGAIKWISFCGFCVSLPSAGLLA